MTREEIQREVAFSRDRPKARVRFNSAARHCYKKQQREKEEAITAQELIEPETRESELRLKQLNASDQSTFPASNQSKKPKVLLTKVRMLRSEGGLLDYFS